MDENIDLRKRGIVKLLPWLRSLKLPVAQMIKGF